MSPLLYTTARVLRHTEKKSREKFPANDQTMRITSYRKKSPAKNFAQMTSIRNMSIRAKEASHDKKTRMAEWLRRWT